MNKQNIKNFIYPQLFNLHNVEIDYCINGIKGQGKLSIDSVQNKIYICQDKVSGFEAPDLLGFKYSYEITSLVNSTNYWKECITNINLPEEKLSVDKLQKEAKIKYPVGTIYKCAKDNTQHTVEERTNNMYDILDVGINAGFLKGFFHYDGKWAEIISKPKEKVITEEMNYKELQDKAWEVFKNVKKGDEYITTTGNKHIASKDAYKSQFLDKSSFIDCGPEFLWKIRDGKEVYGKIISKSEEKTEKIPQFEVGKWYKRDTGSFIKFKELRNNIFLSSESIIATENYKYENKENYYGDVSVSSNKYTLLTDLSEIQQYLPEGHPDKIVEHKEFKKDDYVVVTNEYKGRNGKLNHCYKILEASPSTLHYSSGYAIDSSLVKLRHATLEESMEYDKRGEPYDVTTLQKKEESKSLVGRYLKSLVGRYLKALVDKPQYTDFKKGEYTIITKFLQENTVKIDRKHYEANLSSKDWELMPEGFEPPKQEIQEKAINPMIEIQEEAKKRFPIGCEFINIIGNKHILEKDDVTYKIVDSCIYANKGKGCLYHNGKWATLVEKKEEWIPKVGDWVVINSDGSSMSKYNNTAKKGDIVQILDIRPEGGAATEKDPRYFGKTFNLRKQDFRKTEPHEIPKENNVVDKEPEIDSWCIEATRENQELLIQNRTFFKCNYPYKFSDFGKYYGITKKGVFDVFRDKSFFDKVLTTEEFCKKFNITQSSKYELLDTFEVSLIDKIKPLQETYNQVQYQLQSKLQNNKKENNKTEELMYKTKTIKTFNRNF